MLVKREAGSVGTPPSAAECALAPAWFVFRTPPGKELDTGRLLADLGFVAWCPLQAEWRRAGPGFRVRRRKIARPAFVRYIFAGAPSDGRGRWDAAFKARLIEAILARADGTPLMLKAETVARLAERQRSGEFDRTLAEADPARGIEAGDRVRVVAGPFRGFEYRVEAVSPTSARVLAVLLGAERFVELALDAVEKAA